MRPIRDRDPESFRLITIRTTEARLWIGLSRKVKKLLGGILARYQELLKIELYAYCILGNHMHLLARAPLGNIDEFCENVNREIARRMNWRLKREGQFWGRRYDDQKILTEDDLLEAFLYINTNPTKHGLVADSREWPGLISYDHVIDGQDVQYSFNHYSQELLVTRHKLKISVLPQFKKLGRAARGKKIRALLSERAARLAAERKDKFLGRGGLMNQLLGEKPQVVSRSPRPRCYTKNPELRREFRAMSKARRNHYAYASMRYRVGLEATFPPFSFKPPLHRAPRVVPFKPLKINDFKNAA